MTDRNKQESIGLSIVLQTCFEHMSKAQETYSQHLPEYMVPGGHLQTPSLYIHLQLLLFHKKCTPICHLRKDLVLVEGINPHCNAIDWMPFSIFSSSFTFTLANQISFIAGGSES